MADRHAAWDATGLPEQGENGLAKFNLPDEFLIDKKDWLASLKVLGITTLRVTKDTRSHPWGKHAMALQRTLNYKSTSID